MSDSASQNTDDAIPQRLSISITEDTAVTTALSGTRTLVSFRPIVWGGASARASDTTSEADSDAAAGDARTGGSAAHDEDPAPASTFQETDDAPSYTAADLPPRSVSGSLDRAMGEFAMGRLQEAINGVTLPPTAGLATRTSLPNDFRPIPWEGLQ